MEINQSIYTGKLFAFGANKQFIVKAGKPGEISQSQWPMPGTMDIYMVGLTGPPFGFHLQFE
jgi:hypothetical protein